MIRKLLWSLTIGITATLTYAQPAITTGFDLRRPEISAFIDQLVMQDGFDRAALQNLLAQAHLRPEVIESMNHPAEKTLLWWQYRAHFLTEQRISAGAALWREHRELLDEIAIERGVAPEYIVAILGVETAYGRTTGNYRVLDTLMTFAFEYPRRSEFYRKELEQYLLLARENGIDPLITLGSYGGAMGAAQFMPSSYRNFAVNRSGQTHLDLWSDWNDIFASVANYFNEHGWQTGAPVIAEAELDPARTLSVPDRPTLETIGSLRTQGLVIATSAADTTPAALLGAPLPNAMSYRVGFQNFLVILRYQGSSPLYAMAVCDLAAAIKARVLADSSS